MADQDQIRLPRGTQDVWGETLAAVRAVEAAARRSFVRFGYQEIRSPIFEETRLFSRAIGEATDVVEKEMFTIPREGESYSLRPEATASVVRHYVENSLHKQTPFRKFSYVGPMFRYERPQAGRYRQFQQVGVEAFGSLDPLLDAEVILVVDDWLKSLGMTGQEVLLNTIGSAESRPEVRRVLREAIAGREAGLCTSCQSRLERNVFRVLDCKKEACRAIVKTLPRIEDLVDEESREHFATVQDALAGAGMAFRKEPYLVRGLDYYTRTVFEIVHPSLGAQDAICGGGRYDGLVEQLGGAAMPAVGFASGVERVLLALEQLGRSPDTAPAGLDAFVVSVKPECREASFALVTALRAAALSADMDYEGRGMKAQMKKAARFGARTAILLGPGEVERGTATLRDMETGEQGEVSLDGVAEALRQRA